MLLLAETVSLDMGTILTIGGIVFGAGGVVAGLKIKQALSASKTDDLKTETKENKQKREDADKEILSKLESLGTSMDDKFKEQKKDVAAAEKSMVGRIDQFHSKVFKRLDGLQSQVTEADKRLSVQETEHKHTKEKVERHGRKITMFGQAPRKIDP